MSTTQAPLTPQRIMQMAWGFAAPFILESAVRFQLFDALDGAPKTADELADAVGGSVRGIRAIANALVGLEFLKKEGDRYALTPESAAFLVTTKLGYQGAFLKHISSQLVPAWMHLPQIVRTGTPSEAVNEQGHGSEFFAEFVEAIYPMSAAAAQALADHIFASLATPASVLDIAAGSGVWGIAMAKRSPLVQVTAVDWARVIPTTRRVAEKHAVADRFTYVAGDILLAHLGSGHRLATLGHILHSEGESRSKQLLRRVFDSLAPGGTIAIAEFVPNDERTGPITPLIFAVNMLVNTDEGDAFTFAELSAWLRNAGYVNVRQLNAPGPSPLILADRP